MLHWAIILLVIGLVASIFGFGGFASAAVGLAEGLIVLKVIGVILILVAIGLFARHNSHRSLPH
jgi:uncharacterized membrane protein YtjA (UPF0391 family)